MSLCKYSSIFQKPHEGVHSIRIFNIAVVDTVLTIIAAYFLYIMINKLFNMNISYYIYLIILFIMGIIMHRLFCVRTTIDKLLFGDK